MATQNDSLQTEVEQLRKDLTRLRDEVRVRLKLGAMDVRDAFNKIEHEVEHAARDASAATKRVLVKARDELQALSQKLSKPS